MAGIVFLWSYECGTTGPRPVNTGLTWRLKPTDSSNASAGLCACLIVPAPHAAATMAGWQLTLQERRRQKPLSAQRKREAGARRSKSNLLNTAVCSWV